MKKKSKTLTNDDLNDPLVRRRALEYFFDGNPKPKRFIIGNVPRTGVVHLTTPCHIWTASKKGNYGQFLISGRELEFNYWGLAHRLSYMLQVGPLQNQIVMHLCQNELCVNPDHLKAGTHRENAIQALMNKKRSPNEHPCHMSDLTTEDVRRIRYLYFKKGYPVRILSDTYKKSQTTIRNIVNYNTWQI